MAVVVVIFDDANVVVDVADDIFFFALITFSAVLTVFEFMPFFNVH